MKGDAIELQRTGGGMAAEAGAALQPSLPDRAPLSARRRTVPTRREA